MVSTAVADQSPSGWVPPQAFEEYRLLQLLGRGAMGEVYLAHDMLLDRAVAVKFIAGVAPDAATRRRFFAEAQKPETSRHHRQRGSRYPRERGAPIGARRCGDRYARSARLGGQSKSTSEPV